MAQSHLFIIDGDITQLQCDAWLLPTDSNYSITKAFAPVLGMARPGKAPAQYRKAFHKHCVLAIPSRKRRGSASRTPDVWLGEIGGTRRTPVHQFARRAASFVRQAGEVANLRAGDHPDRVPLIALGVVGSGAGGQRSRRGELLNALLPEILKAGREVGCDVVLVTYGQVMYTAAQRARKAMPDT